MEEAKILKQRSAKIGAGWHVLAFIVVLCGTLLGLTALGALLRAMWWAFTLAWKL